MTLPKSSDGKNITTLSSVLCLCLVVSRYFVLSQNISSIKEPLRIGGAENTDAHASVLRSKEAAHVTHLAAALQHSSFKLPRQEHSSKVSTGFLCSSASLIFMHVSFLRHAFVGMLPPYHDHLLNRIERMERGYEDGKRALDAETEQLRAKMDFEVCLMSSFVPHFRVTGVMCIFAVDTHPG